MFKTCVMRNPLKILVNRNQTVRRFREVCESSGIKLDCEGNVDSLSILEEVFIDRTYSDYFPFYTSSSVLDVGAHKGYFSIFASKSLDPSSRIIAIEPATVNYEIMLKNLARNQINNVQTVKVGVFDRRARLPLHKGRSENNSLHDGTENKLVSGTDETEVIETITLDDVIRQSGLPEIDFMKMDCEGAEYLSLYCAASAVLERIKTLSLEFHDLRNPKFTGLSLANFLEQAGFRIVAFHHGRTNLNLNYGRIIAVRSQQ